MRPTLTVNLSAICTNYQLLKSHHAKHNVAAVVKANAYGLGVAEVSKALWDNGCCDFFVATLEEGIELRNVLPDEKTAKIGVFQGLFTGEEKEYTKCRLTPVLNDISQIERFIKCDLLSANSQTMIHVDTGMTRLGLSETDLQTLSSKLQIPDSKLLIISHLACANTPDHPKNTEQLLRFHTALAHFSNSGINVKASFANSAGVFLPNEFHFDLARTGCALYGISPTDDQKNQMQNVVTLSAPILQIRTLDRDETIGYGATANAKAGARIAIVGIGYADGYTRLLGNKSFAYIAGHKAPIIGRISMDLVAIDVSQIAENELSAKSTLNAEFINAAQTVDDIANAANTIGYEVFTRIGNRVKREYI